jgi:hypothetical protein
MGRGRRRPKEENMNQDELAALHAQADKLIKKGSPVDIASAQYLQVRAAPEPLYPVLIRFRRNTWEFISAEVDFLSTPKAKITRSEWVRKIIEKVEENIREARAAEGFVFDERNLAWVKKPAE